MNIKRQNKETIKQLPCKKGMAKNRLCPQGRKSGRAAA